MVPCRAKWKKLFLVEQQANYKQWTTGDCENAQQKLQPSLDYCTCKQRYLKSLTMKMEFKGKSNKVETKLIIEKSN